MYVLCCCGRVGGFGLDVLWYGRAFFTVGEKLLDLGGSKQCANVIRKFLYMRIIGNGCRIVGDDILFHAHFIGGYIFNEAGEAFFSLYL